MSWSRFGRFGACACPSACRGRQARACDDRIGRGLSGGGVEACAGPWKDCAVDWLARRMGSRRMGREPDRGATYRVFRARDTERWFVDGVVIEINSQLPLHNSQITSRYIAPHRSAFSFLQAHRCPSARRARGRYWATPHLPCSSADGVYGAATLPQGHAAGRAPLESSAPAHYR